MGAALAVLALAVVVLTVLVWRSSARWACSRRASAPRPPWSWPARGPPSARPGARCRSLERRGPELVAFSSPGCRLCAELEPALRALRRDGLPVHALLEDEEPEAFAAYRVPGTPFVVYRWTASWRRKGLVNTLEQVEELIARGEERVAAAA